MNLEGDPTISMSNSNSIGSDGQLQWEVRESVPKSKQGNSW